jgi:hypothetical protein
MTLTLNGTTWPVTLPPYGIESSSSRPATTTSSLSATTNNSSLFVAIALGGANSLNGGRTVSPPLRWAAPAMTASAAAAQPIPRRRTGNDTLAVAAATTCSAGVDQRPDKIDGGTGNDTPRSMATILPA